MNEALEVIHDTSDPHVHVQYKGTCLGCGEQHGSWAIYDVQGQGPTLFLDNELQSCKSDEYIYHELFVHSLLSGCRKPESVLVLGGGEGCMVREILKWPVTRVVQIDWNEELVSWYKTNGRSWNKGAYEDSRVSLVYQDALTWLKESEECFDAIFLDLMDPDVKNLAFFEKLLDLAKSHLKKGGAVSVNAGPTGGEACLKLAHFMATLFPSMYFQKIAFHVYVPSFLGEWCFLAAGSKHWSMYQDASQPPKGLQRYSRVEFVKAITWPQDAPDALRNFWCLGDSHTVDVTNQKLMVKAEEPYVDLNGFGC